MDERNLSDIAANLMIMEAIEKVMKKWFDDDFASSGMTVLELHVK